MRLECNCRCEALYGRSPGAEDVRLSGNSARRVAKATPAAPLPLLADLLEASARFFGRGLKGSGGLTCGLLRVPGLMPAIRGAQAPDGRFREDLGWGYIVRRLQSPNGLALSSRSVFPDSYSGCPGPGADF